MEPFQVEPLEEEVEKALEKKRREKFKKTPYAKMMSESLVKESPELRLADPLVRDEIVEMAFDAGDERQRWMRTFHFIAYSVHNRWIDS